MEISLLWVLIIRTLMFSFFTQLSMPSSPCWSSLNTTTPLSSWLHSPLLIFWYFQQRSLQLLLAFIIIIYYYYIIIHLLLGARMAQAVFKAPKNSKCSLLMAQVTRHISDEASFYLRLPRCSSVQTRLATFLLPRRFACKRTTFMLSTFHLLYLRGSLLGLGSLEKV